MDDEIVILIAILAILVGCFIVAASIRFDEAMNEAFRFDDEEFMR